MFVKYFIAQEAKEAALPPLASSLGFRAEIA
jgi:hypothetical protein